MASYQFSVISFRTIPHKVFRCKGALKQIDVSVQHSEAAKTFSKRHSYRYRNYIFPSGFAAGHGCKSPPATDTHFFHLPSCIWMALNSHMAIEYYLSENMRLHVQSFPWTCANRPQTAVRSRALWYDVYQPVKIFRVYRRHCYRDEQINIRQTQPRFTTKHLWNSNILTDVAPTYFQRELPTKIKIAFLVQMSWCAHFLLLGSSSKLFKAAR